MNRRYGIWIEYLSRSVVPHMKTIDGETMIAVVRSGAWNSQKTGTDGSVPIFEALCVAGLVLSFITPIIITNIIKK